MNSATITLATVTALMVAAVLVIFVAAAKRWAAFAVALVILATGAVSVIPFVLSDRHDVPQQGTPAATPAEPTRVATPAPLRPNATQATPSGAWYTGWRLRGRTLCLESTIPGAPLTFVASQLAAAGFVAPVRTTKDGCAASGYTREERVVIRDMTSAERTGTRYTGMCAATDVWMSEGYVWAAAIPVRITAPQTTACGSGMEWRDLFAHEVGHVVGLSHDQTQTTSIMREGHVFSWEDDYIIERLIYPTSPQRFVR